MPTDRGRAEVAALRELFSESSLIISTDYRGLDVRMINGLRAALRANGVKYRIAKNTLARIAIEEIDQPNIGELIDGPVGYVLWDGDPTVAAKSLVDHVRSERLELEIRGAVLNGEVITAAQVEQLASLPPREVLLAMLLGQLNGPITGLVRVLNGPLQGLATVLQRHIESEAAEEEPTEEPAEATTEEPTGAAAEELSEETTEEPVEEPADESAEEPAEAATEEPAEEVAAEESAEAAEEKPAGEPSVESAEEPAEAAAEEPTEEVTAEESAEAAEEKPADEPADGSTEESKES